jgi:hypothetical protein
MSKEHIPHDSYAAGFVAGWQAVHGTYVAIPALPAQPATDPNMTPFLMGVRMGLRVAGFKIP